MQRKPGGVLIPDIRSDVGFLTGKSEFPESELATRHVMITAASPGPGMAMQAIFPFTRPKSPAGSMGWLRNTVFILHGLKQFTKNGFEHASKTFDAGCGTVLAAVATRAN